MKTKMDGSLQYNIKRKMQDLKYFTQANVNYIMLKIVKKTLFKSAYRCMKQYKRKARQ